VSHTLSPSLDPALPALHLDVLYETDDRGRLLRVRGSDRPPPLAHLLRTPLGNRWLVGATLPEDTAARLETAFADEPVTDPDEWEQHEPRCLETVRALLDPFRRPDVEEPEYRGPAFAFPDEIVVIGASELYLPDGGPSVGASDLAWIASASEEERPLVVARDDHGFVVAVCHSGRATSEGAEAGLATVPEARRRGHALAVTSRWAVEVRASGRTPLYSTRWENEASRAVARRLGLVRYAEDWHLG
jgi:hypothetical protein